MSGYTREGYNVRHRTWDSGDKSSVIYSGKAEDIWRKKSDKSKVNPWIIPLLYPIVTLSILYFIVLHIDSRLPEGVTIAEAVGKKETPVFSAERAMGHLKLLSGIGPKVAGSHENEVLAVDFLVREINWATAALAAREKDRVTISKQRALGWYFLDFKPHGMINSYEGVQNIVVKLASKEPSPDSLLINCHYDSVPTSPGASDDGFHCAVMLELLRVLSEPQAPSLPHNIIFLFNGAEENPLQASHAFITQHEWAKEVRAFINLEAAGAGGKEVLFQAGPGNSWLVGAYAKSVPHPFANVVGEEIFQSGLIPSDTDFRVFRDFGNVPGLDLAHARNGYVYHTKYDDISRTSLGSMQHTGDNLLALIPTIMSAPEFTIPQNSSKLSAESMAKKSIFFDVMGLFMVEYSQGVGLLLNIVTVVLSLVVIFSKSFGGPSSRSEKGSRIILCSAVVFAGWFVGLLFCIGTAFILDTLGCHLSWYSRPALIFPLFYCPAIAGCLLPYVISSTDSSSDPKQKGDPWEKVYVDSLAVQLLWTVVLFGSTVAGIRSSFLFTLMTLFPTIAHLLVSMYSRITYVPVKTWLISRQAFSLVPTSIMLYFGHMFFTLFVPISGRIGAKTNPDLLIGTMAFLMCILAFSHVFPLIHKASSPKIILGVLLGLHCVTMLAAIVTPLGFPYGSSPTEPTPQRVVVLHTKSVREYPVKEQKNFFWMLDMDRNGAHFSLPKAVESGCQIMSDQKCEEILLCGAPVYYSRTIALIPDTHTVPAPEPVIHEPIEVHDKSSRFVAPGLKRISFGVTGPDHISIFVSPASGFKVRDWAFGAVPNASHFWQKNRPIYNIYHTQGLKSDRRPFVVWLDLEASEDSQDVGDDWYVDIAVVGHYTHGDPAARATKVVNETLGPLAPWAHLTAWTAYYHSWRL
ncbi:endoplasmic reticulum metallopeptidase 1-like [Ischnura elegans]|uniref:endoplasmic reticulum metallopeptidase 1-like n=1 Tax=Ischnura elegans TaxID=197161 RepID=UPI001ED8ACC3|nr:endoplasmic reticulum metallopeptidase 1-like [Ischnura elegans]